MAKIGHEGLNNLLAAYSDKSAKAVCTFGYSAGPGQEPVLFQGINEVCTAILPYFFFLCLPRNLIVKKRERIHGKKTWYPRVEKPNERQY